MRRCRFGTQLGAGLSGLHLARIACLWAPHNGEQGISEGYSREQYIVHIMGFSCWRKGFYFLFWSCMACGWPVDGLWMAMSLRSQGTRRLRFGDMAPARHAQCRCEEHHSRTWGTAAAARSSRDRWAVGMT